MKVIDAAYLAPVGSIIESVGVDGKLTGRRFEVLPTCPIIGNVTALDLRPDLKGLKVQVAPFCQVIVVDTGPRKVNLLGSGGPKGDDNAAQR